MLTLLDPKKKKKMMIEPSNPKMTERFKEGFLHSRENNEDEPMKGSRRRNKKGLGAGND